MAPTLSSASLKSPLNFPAVVYRRETFEAVGSSRRSACASGWSSSFELDALDWHHQPESAATESTAAT